MSEPLYACVFNAAGESEPPFHQPLDQHGGVEMLGVFSTWDELQHCLMGGHADVVVVNLDDDGTGIQVVEGVTQLAPGLGILGVSGKSDPSTIIAAMRAGCSQFVCWPIEPDDLRSALDRIRSTARTAPKAIAPQNSKRVCVVSSSGGAGATTIACNLAIELARITERRCALVDMNLEFGDVGCMFDCTPKYSIADVCSDGVEPDRLILSKAMHDLPCNVSILSRPERLEDSRMVTPEGVQAAFRILGEMYPYVVVDLLRVYSFLSGAALAESERVFIVTQLSVPHIRNAARLYESLLQMGAREDSVEIVLNRCKANYERITPDEVEAHFRRPVFAMIPNDYRRVQGSHDLGQPITVESATSPAQQAIQQMARKIASESGVDEPFAAAATGGIFGKLWKRGPKAKA